MKQGIIMEIDERFLTMLTPEGEFLRTRKLNLHYEIGQEIDFFPVDINDRKKSAFLSFFESFKGKSIAAAAMALILTVVTLIPSLDNNEVYAYMSIDINPSIEIGVNDNLKVIELIPYNEDGKKIVKEINDWKKQDIQTVADEIIDEIENQGYIKNNKDITIATVYTGDREKKTDEKIKQEIDSIKQTVEKEDVKLKVLEGTEKDRDKAKKQGVTTGTYKKQKNEKKSKQSVPLKKNHNFNTVKSKPKSTNHKPKPKADAPTKGKDKPQNAQKTNQTHSGKSEQKQTKKTPPGQVKKNQKTTNSTGKNASTGKKATPPGQGKKNGKADSKKNEKKNKKVKKHKSNKKNFHHHHSKKNKYKYRGKSGK